MLKFFLPYKNSTHCVEKSMKEPWPSREPDAPWTSAPHVPGMSVGPKSIRTSQGLRFCTISGTSSGLNLPNVLCASQRRPHDVWNFGSRYVLGLYGTDVRTFVRKTSLGRSKLWFDERLWDHPNGCLWDIWNFGPVNIRCTPVPD